jgi:ABC-type dipeptide/oligopeptide/nickel transport system permease subunit
MRNPAAVASLYVVAILVLFAAFGPLLWVHPYDTIFRRQRRHRADIRKHALARHRHRGRDMVARILIFGLGISLLVGLARL